MNILPIEESQCSYLLEFWSKDTGSCTGTAATVATTAGAGRCGGGVFQSWLGDICRGDQEAREKILERKQRKIRGEESESLRGF